MSQRLTNPDLVEKGQWIYTKGHRVEAWREACATAVVLPSGARQLKYLDSRDREVPYTVRAGGQVWVRDTEEGDQQRTDNPEPDSPAGVVRDDGTLSWGVLRVAKRFRNFSLPTGYDGL